MPEHMSEDGCMHGATSSPVHSPLSCHGQAWCSGVSGPITCQRMAACKAQPPDLSRLRPPPSPAAGLGCADAKMSHEHVEPHPCSDQREVGWRRPHLLLQQRLLSECMGRTGATPAVTHGFHCAACAPAPLLCCHVFAMDASCSAVYLCRRLLLGAL